MDGNHSAKDRGEREKVTLNRTVLVKGHGKKSIGFRGFKIVNSNIKLVKQVEVKAPAIRAKQVANSVPPRKAAVSGTQMNEIEKAKHINSVSPNKPSTADALREIKERIEAKRKNQRLPDSTNSLVTPNGILPDASAALKVQYQEMSQPSSEMMNHSNKTNDYEENPTEGGGPYDRIPVVDTLPNHKIPENIKSTSRMELSNDKNFKEKSQSSPPNHGIKDSTSMDDNKESSHTSKHEYKGMKQLHKTVSNARAGEEDSVSLKNDDRSKRHDRHSKSHRKSKRDSGGGGNFEQSPVLTNQHFSSCRDRNYHSHDRVKKRDCEKEEYHSKYSRQKHSDSRKHRERSKSPSPSRERERRHHGKDRHDSVRKVSVPDKPRSPYREKDIDVYSSRSRPTDRDSAYHHKEYSNTERSKHKQKTNARKYSSPRNDRDSTTKSSHTKKFDSRRNDVRSKHHHSESQHQGRSSKLQRRSDEKDSYLRKYSSKEAPGNNNERDRDDGSVDRKTSSPRMPRTFSTDKKDDFCHDKNKRDGLFSKLSIAFSLDGEDEDYEVETPASERNFNKVEAVSPKAECDKSRCPHLDTESPLNSSSDQYHNDHLHSGNDDVKTCYQTDQDSTADEESIENMATRMVIVDEVKTDSSEYEIIDERADSSDAAICENEIDRCSTNETESKFHVENTVNEDPLECSDVAVANRSCIATEGNRSHVEFETSNTLDGDCEYAIGSPPTPLMDEPQDEIIFMNRANGEQMTESIVPVSNSVFKLSKSNDLSHIDVDSVKSTFDKSASHATSPASNLISESSVPQNSHQTECTKPLYIIDQDRESMQNNNDCNRSNSPSELLTQTPALVSTSESLMELTCSESNLLSSKTNKTDRGSCVSDVPSPPKQSSLYDQNKLPTITSRLESVYKSLLQTSFQTIEGERTSGNVNGLISKKAVNPEDALSVTESMGLPSDTLETKNHSVHDSKPECQEGEDSFEVAEDDIGDDESPLSASQPNIPRDETVSLLASHFPRDSSVKTSPHKLKLHATTKTPLPAKKSYIQQVRPQVKLQDKKMLDTSVSIPRTLLSSDPPQQDDSAINEQDVLDQSTSSDCAKSLETHSIWVESCLEDSNLCRQDSNSSGVNDNEEGPRRSARIRTKKTERSLKKQASVDANQSQNDLPSTTDLNSEVVEPVADVTKVCERNLFECDLKDLSEEDLFKVKICLASGISDSPDRFHILDENLYLTSVKKSRARKEIKRMVCDCCVEDSSDSEDYCGENCLNRLLMIECSSRCLYGNKCTNKRFQMRRYAPTEVFKTDFKGWGIRAAEDIAPEELVMEYCGEVVDQREFTRRSLEYSKSNHAHFYFMALSQDEVIDATYKGNASRFINHSCDPNAETQKWTVNGRLRVGFFTVKSIKKGEEITFDYQFERYGKIAQKCYCGTAKCRGYLGKAPDENDENDAKFSKLLSTEEFLEVDDADSPEKMQKKKKISLFQDDTMEKDILKLKGGLQSTKDVLTLSRLMVRCDTHAQRSMCLQVLKDTSCQTRLKTFLKFHGLSIIWSWMVDIPSVENNEAASLKMEIIKTLCILPINNRNIIEDSKVLSVVQRWATPEEKPDPTEEKAGDGKGENDTDGDATEEKEVASTCETTGPVNSQDAVVENTTSLDNIVSCEDLTSQESIPADEKENTERISTENLLEAAIKLLDSWKDLKEIYRIPKRQRPLPSPSQDSSSRTSSPIPKQFKVEDSDVKVSRPTVNAWRDGSLERWKEFSEKSVDSKFRDSQASPGSNTSSENKREPGRRKRRFSTDSDDGTVPWHCKPPRGSRVSKEEHRRRFEQDVVKKEQEKRRQEEMEAEIARNTMMNNQHGYMVEEIPSHLGQNLSIMASNTTFTPGGVSGNLIQINPAPIMVDQFGQQVDVLPPLMQQNMFNPQMPVQQGFTVQQSMQGMFNPDMNTQEGFQDPYALQVSQMHGGIPMTGMHQQQMLSNTIGVANHQSVSIDMQHIAQPPLPTVQQPQQPTNNVTILGTQNGQAIVMLSAEQLQKLTQGDVSSVTSSSKQTTSPTKKSEEKETDTKKPTDADAVPTMLPPNWKTATDPDGRVYYYHNITRETQWDPPKLKGVSSEKSEEASSNERQSKQKDKQDRVTDEGRKAKDQFRLKMSQFVIQCLSSFRKPDRKMGRITSTEDFKHLARKLTHIIMQKELKQVQVLEDLDFNANVKHKTKEYVKKYMSKVGPVYRIKDDT